jgi:hypothetical protein
MDETDLRTGNGRDIRTCKARTKANTGVLHFVQDDGFNGKGIGGHVLDLKMD